LVPAMLGGAFVTWLRSRPFIDSGEVSAATEAARFAETAPPGTPLVFLVDNKQATISFFATRAGNVIRDAMPPDRIRDVYLYVGSPKHYVAREPTLIGRIEHDALSRQYFEDLRGVPSRRLAFILEPFNVHGFLGAQY